MGGGLGGVAISRTGGRIASWTSSSASNGQIARMSFSSQRREVIASNVGRLLWSKRVQSSAKARSSGGIFAGGEVPGCCSGGLYSCESGLAFPLRNFCHSLGMSSEEVHQSMYGGRPAEQCAIRHANDHTSDGFPTGGAFFIS